MTSFEWILSVKTPVSKLSLSLRSRKSGLQHGNLAGDTGQPVTVPTTRPVTREDGEATAGAWGGERARTFYGGVWSAQLHTRLLTPAQAQGCVLHFPLGKQSLTELPTRPPPLAWHCAPLPPTDTRAPRHPCPWTVLPSPGATALSVGSALLGKRRPLWKPPDPSQHPAQQPPGTSPGLATASHGASGQQRGCSRHSRLLRPKYQTDMPWSRGPSWDNVAFHPMKRLCG